MGHNSTYEPFSLLHLLLSERLVAFSRWVKNFVLTGFNVLSGGGLNITVGNTTFSSYAYVDGYEIIMTALVTKALTNNATNYVYITFTKNADSIAGTASIVPAITVNTTGIAPSNSLRIAVVVTAGGAISSITPDDVLFSIHDAKLTTDLDCKQNQLRNLVHHKGTAFPSSPVVGQVYYRTDADAPFVRTAGGWESLFGGGSSDLGYEVVNVMDFGAVGDGVTDDTAAIQAAFDSIVGAGAIVFFPRGTYKITASITQPDASVLMKGAGIGNSILSMPVFAGEMFEVPDGLTARRRYEVSDLEFIGGGIAGQEFWCFDDANGRADAIIERCRITEFETIVEWMKYNEAYTTQSNFWINHSQLVAIAAGSILVATPNPAGSFFGAVAFRAAHTTFADGNSYPPNSWSADADCDLWVYFAQVGFALEAGTAFNGISMRASNGFPLGAGDITFYGNGWDVYDYIDGGCQFIGVDTGTRFVFHGGHMQLTDVTFAQVGVKLHKNPASIKGWQSYGAIGANPVLEIHRDSVNNRPVNFEGMFIDHTGTGTLIKLNNATNVSIRAAFKNLASGIKTIEETGSSDKNKYTGCVGLAASDGPTIIGDSSSIEGELLFEGRLQADSATQISLQRYKGRHVVVNGEYVGIPSGGLTRAHNANRIDATGADAGASLAVDTLYYVYVSNGFATFSPSSIRLSTVAPSSLRGAKYLGTSGNAANWRFVGWVRTIDNAGTPNFVDSTTQRLVVNFYNRIRVPVGQIVPGYVDDNALTSFNEQGATGVVWRPLNGGTGVKIEFISNGEDVTEIDWDFVAEITAGTPDFAFSVADDGSLNPSFASAGWAANGAAVQNGHSSRRPVYAEGYHYVTYLFAMNDAGGTVKVYTDTNRFGGSADPRLTKMNGHLMA